MIKTEISNHLKRLLSPEQVVHYGVVIVNGDEDNLEIVHKCETKDLQKEELELILNRNLAFEKIDVENFDRLISSNYRMASSPGSSRINLTDDVFENIVNHANNAGASDIHIEPSDKQTRIRFRIDGALKQFYQFPASEHALLVNKIKIKANLNISEKRRNQDGRITQKIGVTIIDIRVSTLPSLYGEKIVLRLLETEQEDVDIDKIGLSEEQKKIYQKAYSKTNGIILISGPTGSGKTTTLYATLKELNKESLNILTVEDPIEYTLNGINQVQIKHDIGFDFASALKTFLRQDPDIIMVGEIRDTETAQMAVKAALTGHLVLSTIHTNSALGTLDRLIDMGVPKYLIASTLNLSVAQRLVRLLCNDCKKSELSKLDFFNGDDELETNHYKSNGCSSCNFTGYKGRTALFEMIEIGSKISENIKLGNSIIKDEQFSNYRSIKKQAIDLLKSGNTSYEEIFPLLIE
ncbi:MAG: GspE/PulE family protein [Nonlabens sp.]